MLTLTRTHLRAETTSPFTDREVEAIGRRVYESAELAAKEFIRIEAVGTEVRIEEGSLAVAAIILATAHGLFVAINGYGGFWEGLEKIREHARAAGRFVRQSLMRDSTLRKGRIVSSRITTGDLARLDRLRTEVAAGHTGPAEAVGRALGILQSAGEPVDASLVTALKDAFEAPPIGPDVTHKVAKAREHVASMPRPREGRAERRRRGRKRLTILRRPGEPDVQVEFDHDE